MSVIRLAADRDIKPESDDSPSAAIENDPLREDGTNATKIMARMLTNVRQKARDFIEYDILTYLNHICDPDEHFERILAQFKRK